MEVSEHIEALTLDGERMARAARSAGPAAPVPSCPEWVVRDLVRHVGGVHRWATGVVATPWTEPRNVGLDEVVGTWPGDDELIEWFAAGHAGLVAALTDAPPDLECWAFLRAPSPLAHWSRRQAHETSIHRLDAELALGAGLSPVDPAFARDGIDELLCAFVPRRSTKLRAAAPTTLLVHASDDHGDPAATGVWLLQIGPDGLSTTSGPAVADSDASAATCAVSGRAADLYRALWNRGGVETLSVEGDPGVLEDFLDSVHIRLS